MHTGFGARSAHRGRVGTESIREIVFGVEDGVVQNMTLIAGMVGAALSNKIIIVAAAINAIAGVLSMSVGTYLSSKAERDVLAAQAGAGAPGSDSAIATPRLRSPPRDAFVMAGAYALGAVIPLIPFGAGFNRGVAVTCAVVLTGLTLFFLGVGKASLSHQSRIRSGVEMLLLASAAGLAGFLLGIVARSVFGIEV